MRQVKLTSTENKLHFSLSGEIDSATSEDFYAEVKTAYLHDKKDIEFDCTLLTFIDSTMLGTFVKLFKELKADGFKTELKNVHPRIRKLFEICSLDRLMVIK